MFLFVIDGMIDTPLWIEKFKIAIYVAPSGYAGSVVENFNFLVE